MRAPTAGEWIPEMDGLTAEHFVNQCNAIGAAAVAAELRRDPDMIAGMYAQMTIADGALNPNEITAAPNWPLMDQIERALLLMGKVKRSLKRKRKR